jgi:hypothetical protein
VKPQRETGQVRKVGEVNDVPYFSLRGSLGKNTEEGSLGSLSSLGAEIAAILLRDGTWVEVGGSKCAAPAQPSAEGLLDSKGLAALLNVPETQVEALARAGTIPSVMVGRYRRYTPSHVLAALPGGQSEQIGPRGRKPPGHT